MNKRLPLLALCLTVAALGTTACDASGGSPSSASSAPSTPSASPSASAPAPASPSAEARTLTGMSSALYLRTLRKNYPDLDHLGDDVLVTHGNALCAARGAALGDAVKKTMRELGTNTQQTTQILGTAHAFCR
ncbi:hypothetical protein [Streptomyces sp. NPDC053048]|uniref:hypothetical protein n=1 Tax=Streptomyces sp. NPDC053048 TaxID=3365694 RepID=UPI0037D62932